MEKVRQLKIFLRGVNVGILSYDEASGVFTYNSNIEEEQKFCKVHHKSLEDYDLWGSVDLKTQAMPEVFDYIVKEIKNRDDILKVLKVSRATKPFDVLWEYGKFPQHSPNGLTVESIGENKITSSKKIWGVENWYI